MLSFCLKQSGIIDIIYFEVATPFLFILLNFAPCYPLDPAFIFIIETTLLPPEPLRRASDSIRHLNVDVLDVSDSVTADRIIAVALRGVGWTWMASSWVGGVLADQVGRHSVHAPGAQLVLEALAEGLVDVAALVVARLRDARLLLLGMRVDRRRRSGEGHGGGGWRDEGVSGLVVERTSRLESHVVEMLSGCGYLLRIQKF